MLIVPGCRSVALLLAIMPGLVGCDEEPSPELARPLAAWRQTGIETRVISTFGGPVLEIPVSRSVTCTTPYAGNPNAMCFFTLDEATGRPLVDPAAQPGTLDVAMSFEVGRYTNAPNAARIHPDQWPGSDEADSPSAPVLQHAEGRSHGRRFAIGCWRELTTGPAGKGVTAQGPYACTLAIENASIGATEVRFPAPEPPRETLTGANPPFDRARLDRIVATIVAVEASFLRPGAVPAAPGR